mgnify:CR=1 FL=1
MLSKSETVMLCNAIREMTGQDFSEAGEQLFAASLSPTLTINGALKCLAEWNTREHAFNKVSAGDLNAIWKQHRPSSVITEGEIGRMLEPLNLTADEMWAARRALIGNLNRGMPQQAALSSALDAAHGRLLPSAPVNPKPTHNHHFAGNLSLGDVIGHE